MWFRAPKEEHLVCSDLGGCHVVVYWVCDSLKWEEVGSRMEDGAVYQGIFSRVEYRFGV